MVDKFSKDVLQNLRTYLPHKDVLRTYVKISRRVQGSLRTLFWSSLRTFRLYKYVREKSKRRTWRIIFFHRLYIEFNFYYVYVTYSVRDVQIFNTCIILYGRTYT